MYIAPYKVSSKVSLGSNCACIIGLSDSPLSIEEVASSQAG